jgi:hypothetical protein
MKTLFLSFITAQLFVGVFAKKSDDIPGKAFAAQIVLEKANRKDDESKIILDSEGCYYEEVGNPNRGPSNAAHNAYIARIKANENSINSNENSILKRNFTFKERPTSDRRTRHCLEVDEVKDAVTHPVPITELVDHVIEELIASDEHLIESKNTSSDLLETITIEIEYDSEETKNEPSATPVEPATNQLSLQ